MEDSTSTKSFQPRGRRAVVSADIVLLGPAVSKTTADGHTVDKARKVSIQSVQSTRHRTSGKVNGNEKKRTNRSSSMKKPDSWQKGDLFTNAPKRKPLVDITNAHQSFSQKYDDLHVTSLGFGVMDEVLEQAQRGISTSDSSRPTAQATTEQVTFKMVVMGDSPLSLEEAFKNTGPSGCWMLSTPGSVGCDGEGTFKFETFPGISFEDFAEEIEESLGYPCLFRGLEIVGKQKVFIPIPSEEFFRRWVRERMFEDGKNAIIDVWRKKMW